MPRTARLLMDGGAYHVLTRGNNGQALFREDDDYQWYLRMTSACAAEHHLKLFHFALMPNHVHLVLEAPVGSALSKAMLVLNITYAWRYRKRYEYTGHLWQGRFKSLLIDRESYLLECGRYVELNPVRAKMVRDPRDYPWSSYRVYAEGVDNPLITPNPLYATLGATAQERQYEYRRFIHDGIQHEAPVPLARYHFIGGTSASMKSFERQFGMPGIKRRPGRPKKPEMRNVPIVSNRRSDEK